MSAPRRHRLALSGSAGTGKSTLGLALGHALGVPYIAEGMRRRLESGLNLHTLGHNELARLVRELWVEQCAIEDAAILEHGGFVADRSSVDFIAFWLYYHFTEDVELTNRIYQDTLQRAASYDRIILLPWGVLPLVADGVRSTNPWTQRHYQATVEGLLFREVGPPRLAVMPALTDPAERLDWALDALPRESARGAWGNAKPQ